MKINQYLKNGKKIFFTIFTQGILSLAAIVIGFGLPKFLSVDEYSRWQIYYFYVAYVNYLQLGFNDGLVLNYSGNEFQGLPWNNIKRAISYILVYVIVLSAAILLCGDIIGNGSFQIITFLVYSFIPTILMCICNALLLAGNRTYSYNLFNLAIRITFVILMICGIVMKVENAEFYIIADILSKGILVLFFLLRERKDMSGTDQVQSTGRFIKVNCSAGIIVASTILILGLLPMCGRVLVQFGGNSADYARYSFAISMLSIILTFTNAIGTVAFPMLKSRESGLEGKQYNSLSLLYDEILILCLWFLSCIEFIITHFLQEYISILEYFPILMAICWPLGKIESIIYPYYKLYRREKDFLIISIACLVLTFGVSYFFYLFLGLFGLASAALICVVLYDLILQAHYYKVIGEKHSWNISIFVVIIIFILFGLKLDILQFSIAYGVVLLCRFILRKTKGKILIG